MWRFCPVLFHPRPVFVAFPGAGDREVPQRHSHRVPSLMEQFLRPFGVVAARGGRVRCVRSDVFGQTGHGTMLYVQPFG